ncbi:MAG: hypothetical protein H7222_13310 [Methylotenera sp.]|nr:hypothetical protein [Oligoflexia bacterium]
MMKSLALLSDAGEQVPASAVPVFLKVMLMGALNLVSLTIPKSSDGCYHDTTGAAAAPTAVIAPVEAVPPAEQVLYRLRVLDPTEPGFARTWKAELWAEARGLVPH